MVVTLDYYWSLIFWSQQTGNYDYTQKNIQNLKAIKEKLMENGNGKIS
jgi:hypothetical protein